MKLNIEKLKSKLNNISSEVSYKIEKDFHPQSRYYFNTIYFNDLIRVYVKDREDIKYDIEYLSFWGNLDFCIDDFGKMRATLDFIENNEQAIKTAMLESIEE